jgi:magnesium transporter
MTPPDRALQRHVESIGRAPGTIVAPSDAPKPNIDVTLYDRERCEVRRGVAAESLAGLAADGRIAWVDVVGLGDQAVIEKLIEVLDVPWLAMEDVLHSPQRPKVDAYDGARFIVMRMFDRPGTCDMDQFSIFVRGRVVVTFQERPGDPFEVMRRRLPHAESQIRQRGADYLVYRFIDACVDSIFPEMQRVADTVELIEDVAIKKPTAKLIRDLHSLRRELRILERVALGTRDAVAALARDEEGFFDRTTRPYLHDVLDHASQIVELAHYYTTVANDIGTFILGTLDLHMNQVMRVLAGVTVVLMPPALVAGIYGMNFENMPELHTTWGYFAALGLIVVLAGSLAFWMRRIGWIRLDAE